jgi:hypothetical protein
MSEVYHRWRTESRRGGRFSWLFLAEEEGGGEQGKSFRKLGSHLPSSLSCILKICSRYQGDDQIINGSHAHAGIADCHARGNFLENRVAVERLHFGGDVQKKN